MRFVQTQKLSILLSFVFNSSRTKQAYIYAAKTLETDKKILHKFAGMAAQDCLKRNYRVFIGCITVIASFGTNETWRTGAHSPYICKASSKTEAVQVCSYSFHWLCSSNDVTMDEWGVR